MQWRPMQPQRPYYLSMAPHTQAMKTARIDVEGALTDEALHQVAALLPECENLYVSNNASEEEKGLLTVDAFAQSLAALCPKVTDLITPFRYSDQLK